MSEVRIEMTGHGRGEVWIDGLKVQATAVEFAAAVGDLNVVKVSLIPERVVVAGMADVAVRKSGSWCERLLAWMLPPNADRGGYQPRDNGNGKPNPPPRKP